MVTRLCHVKFCCILKKSLLNFFHKKIVSGNENKLVMNFFVENNFVRN